MCFRGSKCPDFRCFLRPDSRFGCLFLGQRHQTGRCFFVGGTAIASQHTQAGLKQMWNMCVSNKVGCSMVYSSNYTDVSKNSDTPKSSILIGFSIINHPFWGTPIFGNTHIVGSGACSQCDKDNSRIIFHCNLRYFLFWLLVSLWVSFRRTPGTNPSVSESFQFMNNDRTWWRVDGQE